MVSLITVVMIAHTNGYRVPLNMFEATTHSFVIKIWLEETWEESDRAVWRGRITHVASGERKFIKDLPEILAFIWPYLDELGVDCDSTGRSGTG